MKNKITVSFCLDQDCIDKLQEIVDIKNCMYADSGMKTSKSMIVQSAIEMFYDKTKFLTKLGP